MIGVCVVVACTMLSCMTQYRIGLSVAACDALTENSFFSRVETDHVMIYEESLPAVCAGRDVFKKPRICLREVK